MSRPGGSGESGSATVLGLVTVALLTTAALVAAAVAGVLVGHRRVAAAADLAALAGATAVQEGRAACAAAARVAVANGARLGGCQVSGEIVTVEAVADVRSGLWPAVRVSSRSRAGPG